MLINKKRKYMKIQGKDYVEVKDRVLQFREEKPDWSVDTTVISNCTETGCIVMKATVYDEQGKVRSSGHAHEWKDDPSSFVNKTSHLENCETSAIGRALGLLGYGIMDSFASADEVRIAQSKASTQKAPNRQIESTGSTDWESAIVPIGKNKGKTLGELAPRQRTWYIDNFEANPNYEDSVAFREALDQCGGITLAPKADETFEEEISQTDEISGQLNDDDGLDEDVPF